MWDGVYGRTHTYSYIKGTNGRWYKSVESTVTEVSCLLSCRIILLNQSQVDENAVLSDSTGLHMGAGPFMLLYSKTSASSLSTVPEEKPQEDQPVEQEQEKPDRPPLQRSYTTVAEEYAQWHPKIRQTVRNWNAQFRTTLEDAGVVNADGKILQNLSNEQGELVLQEDPLSRMYFEETEDSMEYDSDARDIQEDVVMDTTASMAGWGLSDVPTVSQDVDIDGWGPQGKGTGSWDDATKEADWHATKDPEWDEATTKESWKPSSATEKRGIEVQITRDVESKVEGWGVPE